jgi:hypothetical protein
VDGPLGRGLVAVVRLSPGAHRIELRAGEGDRAGTSAVDVQVE